ncbi:hypothetical protein ACV35H_33940, partial [Pseudomonas aeruginosa]
TPTVDERSGTLKVKVGLDSVPAEMSLGSVVNACVAAPAEHSVVLPWSAMYKAGEQPAVRLLDQQGKARLQPARVARYASDKVVIARGLEAGQTVLTVRGPLLHPGQLVDLAQPPQPESSSAKPHRPARAIGVMAGLRPRRRGRRRPGSAAAAGPPRPPGPAGALGRPPWPPSGPHPVRRPRP